MNTYYAVVATVKPSEMSPGGLLAFSLVIHANEDVWHRLNAIEGLQNVLALPSLKRAKEVAAAWNDSFRRNGTYAW